MKLFIFFLSYMLKKYVALKAPWPAQDDDACAWWCVQVPFLVVYHVDHADVNSFE